MEDKQVCSYCGKECKNPNSKRNHERLCKQNPNYTSLAGENNPHFGKKGSNHFIKAKEKGLPKPIIPVMESNFKGKKHTEESRRKMSEKAKLNHKTGKAKTFGDYAYTRASKSELEFIKIIEESICDKEYTRELVFSKYKLDFAWKHRKVCIELDGKQHLQEDRMLSDKNKDTLLMENGWKVLRIENHLLFSDRNSVIEKVNKFISSNEVLPENLQWKTKEELYEEKLALARKEGKINKDGRISYSKLSNEVIETRNKLILNSDIDFSKFGWVGKVSKLINFPPQKVNKYMKKYLADFYNESCFKRA